MHLQVHQLSPMLRAAQALAQPATILALQRKRQRRARVQLTHVPLTHVLLTHAPLTHALLIHAPLTHAPLTHAPLTHALLTHAQPTLVRLKLNGVHLVRPGAHPPSVPGRIFLFLGIQ